MNLPSEFLEETKLLGITAVATLQKRVVEVQHSVAMRDFESVVEQCEQLIKLLTVVKEEHIIYLTERTEKEKRKCLTSKQ